MRKVAALVLVVSLLWVAPAMAQHDHMDLYSSEAGGGSLVVDYDFSKKFVAFETFCAAGLCLYSTINPAFMAPETDDAEKSLFRLDDGTKVYVEIIDADPEVTLNVDGARLKKAGDAAPLGTMPPIHNHPSWQLVVTDGVRGEFTISYKFRTDSPQYGESQEYTSIVTNAEQEAIPPCPPYPCPGDCDDDGAATAAEIREGVAAALTGGTVDLCLPMDSDLGGVITIDEIVGAVGLMLSGCPERLEPTLANVQEMLFTPTCAITTCHNAASASGALVLAPGTSHDELVGVTPDIDAAEDAGLLRVAAGDPDRSFLYRKLVGPRPEWGSRMPLNGACLLPEQIDLVRRWIAAGAPAE